MPGQTWARELATTVRARRKLLKLTQTQLAELAGCGPAFLYDLEHAKPTLRIDKLLSVLEVLGLTLSITKVGATVATSAPASSGDWIRSSRR